jgi:DNA-directed RNA polymerase subunit K/omega
MSNTLDKIINTVTANRMREITVERAKQIAIEYAAQVPDRESELIEMLEKAIEDIDKQLYMFSQFNESDRFNQGAVSKLQHCRRLIQSVKSER